jgi:[lysine-biosynthesis-protein LysW]---L-2-aminoadipate ligase
MTAIALETPSRALRRETSSSRADAMPAIALIAHRLSPTNAQLLQALLALGVSAFLARPQRAGSLPIGRTLGIGRLDVLSTLDGIEPGLAELRRLEEMGMQVLNGSRALSRTHDKLTSALSLAAAGVPHPRTRHAGTETLLPELELPVVVKPRFGAWGVNVAICRDRDELQRHLRMVSSEGWFARQGALVQEYIPTGGRDLHLIVACGQVVGATERRAAPGDWRTTISKGARRLPIVPTARASALAVAAAEAVGADLAGVEILHGRSGDVVLELDTAVEFTTDYSLPRTDVFDLVARRVVASATLATVRLARGESHSA